MNKSLYTILYIDDDAENLRTFKLLFEDRFDIITGHSAEEGLELLRNWEVQLIISDQKMPGISGIEFFKQTLSIAPEVSRMIVSGYAEIDLVLEAINQGNIHRYLTKPWLEEEMLNAIESSLEMWQLKADNHELVNELQEVNAHLEAEVERRTNAIEQQKNELQLKNEELIKLDAEKDELIGVVAHDLRSPLNQIKGLANLAKLTMSVDTNEAAIHLDKLLESADRLTNMITRILDVNEAISGKINMKFEQVEVASVLQKTITFFEVAAHKKDISIQSELLPKCTITIDENYFIQVMENLISNAIKFSPEKSMVWVKMLESSSETLRIGVIDQGPGISAEERNLLFKRFQKLSAKPTAGETSTGLGLSITKRYVEAMQGKIWHEDNPEGGAIFFLEFPASFA